MTPGPPPFLPAPATTLIGYFCFTEIRHPQDSIVESEGRFFRLDLSGIGSHALKPLTPVIFSSSHVSAPALGIIGTPTFSGTFTKVFIDGSSGLQPHPIEGKVIDSDRHTDRMTFCWNPQQVFHREVKVTVLRSLFPGVVMDSSVRVTFSIRPPTSRNVSGAVFPFPSSFSLVSAGALSVDPPYGIPPPLFLQDLAESPQLNFHMGIGLPENDSIPTLSFSDFLSLNSANNLDWVPVVRMIHFKYQGLAKGREGAPQKV